MKIEVYNALIARQGMTRRAFLEGAAAIGSLAAVGVGGGPAIAQDSIRAQIMNIPGVGKGSPSDADRQKVGELCLGPTKAAIKEGEFKGVEISFMGVNTSGVHNVVYRGFLKAWEDYTGCKINWIDLAQTDYGARLTQAIATGTVDWDIFEMGAALEGDPMSKGMLDEMPDWVAKQIEIDEYVDYLKAPVGTWEGKTYRVSVDGDTLTMNYRTDYFKDPAITAATGITAVPTTWQRMAEFTKKVKGQKDPLTGGKAYGYLDSYKPWGGYDFYYLTNRAVSYVKYPGNPAFLFDPETMKPYINNPGWVQGIQDHLDMLKYQPDDQINADPLTTAFQQFMAGTGSALSWWGDVGTRAMTDDASMVGNVISFAVSPGSDRVFNVKTNQWETPSQPNVAPNMATIGWGIYVTNRVSGDEKKRKAAWSAAAHLGGKDLSLWTSAYPSGFQPYRKSNFNYDEWVAAGYDRDYITAYLKANLDSYTHPNAAIEPRIPGLFQYYSVAEDELAKFFTGQYKSAQEAADAIAAAWEKITDQIGREKQIKYYRTALGV
ncbi:MAG: sugar ABC transporter substrate-binding protein [Mesorhizobium sp.]|nr:MAG: sugar ABC transporter substrate-binding protein [Mesorhizobium sp.]